MVFGKVRLKSVIIKDENKNQNRKISDRCDRTYNLNSYCLKTTEIKCGVGDKGYIKLERGLQQRIDQDKELIIRLIQRKLGVINEDLQTQVKALNIDDCDRT